MLSLPKYVLGKPNYQDFLDYIAKNSDLLNQINLKDAHGADALYWALDGELEDIAHWLLEHGANATADAVYAAAQRGYYDILKTLVEKGAPFEECFAVGGFPPLIAACCEARHYYKGNLQVHKTVNGQQVLVTDPAEIERIAGKDRYSGFGKIVAYLLEKGANPNATVNKKPFLTALHYCGEHGQTNLAKMVLEAGGKLDTKSAEGLTPLHYAARADWKLETAKLFIEHGADTNAQENYGFTPLHEAAENQAENMIKMLLDAGANTSLGLTKALSPYAVGDTAYHVAQKRGFSKITAIFEQFKK